MKKKVILITTGGTIASKENSKGLLSSGALSGKELADLCQLPKDIEIKIVDVFQLPSMHIDNDNMLLIRQAILNELEDESVNGVVVTHGTDSLEETAYFLDLTIDHKLPIVVTGSQRSPAEVGTDVFSNLRNSFYVAIEETLHHVGTVVVFNERIYTAKYVKKVHASNLQGFDSFGHGYLGIIDNDVVSIYQKPINRETFKLKSPLPRVDIIKCYAGADGYLIDMLVLQGTSGIILEGVGRGQVSPQMVTAIDGAIEAGIKVVVTTSAEEGKVHPSYSYKGSADDLLQRGVILGEDYDSKKARLRLIVQLASGVYEKK
ncbi:asparaginase [Paenisporosarcina sp. TG20]|uniref:asparaginase n=1 Tax=Paenisporosarcina sp. TG20 TaxID=1211706 RepID=UPI0003081484|nr:asparaginase [Paenisporosarcina sp. TG20]